MNMWAATATGCASAETHGGPRQRTPRRDVQRAPRSSAGAAQRAAAKAPQTLSYNEQRELAQMPDIIQGSGGRTDAALQTR